MPGKIPLAEVHIIGKIHQEIPNVVGRIIKETPNVVGRVYAPQIIGEEIYSGEYVVVPAREEKMLKTSGKTLEQNVVVKEIPSYEVGNDSGGTTFIIGRELNG